MGKTVGKILGIAAHIFVDGVLFAFGTAVGGPVLGVALVVAGETAYTAATGGFSSHQPAATPLTALALQFAADAPRKLALGRCTLAVDGLYAENSEPTTNFYADYIIGNACHKIDGHESIYVNNKLLWSAAGGIAGEYAGYAWVTPIGEGTSANAITINSGTKWDSSCRLTGCAYLHLRIKRTGNDSKATSPFSEGLPGNMRIIGRGLPVYDPRRDSTRGGSGSHRAEDQTTWQWTATDGTEIGQNHALQALTVLIGWRIGGEVSVGGDQPLDQIDYAEWITAANICDEAVTLKDGGSQRRYEGGGLFTDDDGTAGVLTTLCQHMIAELRDPTGKIGIRVAVNDFSGTLPAFGPADILGTFSFEAFAAINDSFNIVRGTFVDPSATALYQPAPYAEEGFTSRDGRNRVLPLDLKLCQHPERAQRIARQVLRREQYSTAFGADYGPRAWGVNAGQCLTQTMPQAGLSNVIFRVQEQSIKIVTSDDDARTFCPMKLRIEVPEIYVWNPADAVNPPAAVAPVDYDPLSHPFVQGIEDASVRVTLPPGQVYSADYLGALTEPLTAASVGVARGAVSIKLDDATDYAIATSATIAAAIDNTDGSATKGDIVPSAFTGNSAWIDVTVTAGGVVQPVQRLTFVKDLAMVPSAGGVGAKAASDTSLTATASTSLVAITDVLTVTIASGESLYGTGSIDYYPAASAPGSAPATRTVSVRWQYAVAGSGSWSDFVASTSITGSTSTSGRYSAGEFIDASPGHVDATQTKGGLSAGNYDVRLLALVSASGRTVYFDGTARVEARV